MKVGFIQTYPKFGDKEKNIDDVVQKIFQTDADLLVIPELFSTGYLFTNHNELADMAEEIPGKTTEILSKIAQKQQVCLVAGIAEKYDNKFYNSSVMLTPDGKVNVYRKIHLFMEEKKWFAPGNLPFNVHSIKNIKIGMMICFDWWFPESARTLALKGAHIICHPANLVLAHCQKVMLSRSLENKVFTITANRVGEDIRENSKIGFTGLSQIIDPMGNEILSTGRNTQVVKTIEINPLEAENKQLTPMNNLFEDRRPEFYFN